LNNVINGLGDVNQTSHPASFEAGLCVCRTLFFDERF